LLIRPSSIRFVELTTSSLALTLGVLKRFGFACEARPYKGRTVLRHEGITLFVTSPKPEKFDHVRLETYVSRIGLLCQEGKSAGEVLSENQDLASPCGVLFHVIDQKQWHEWESQREFPECPRQGPFLSHIDHVALNLFPTQLELMGRWLEASFGMTALPPHEIKGHSTSFLCSPYEGPSFSIVLNTSTCATSQITAFLEASQGASVQHIAFATRDIFRAIEKVRQKGVPFIEIPSLYYDALEREIPLHPNQVSVLKHAGVLYDQDLNTPDHQLLQTFTRDLFGPIFFELIERRARRGFGEGNIEALFKAVEAQTKR
jgi:4-hydroxyphenylpyruvate dioxygenase-like putative hemolysin